MIDEQDGVDSITPQNLKFPGIHTLNIVSNLLVTLFTLNKKLKQGV
jgi:hypothetical protein